MPVEDDSIRAGSLEGEEHSESLAVGQADPISFVAVAAVAVDVVDEEGVADEARHVDVDLLLALAAAELRGGSDLDIIYHECGGMTGLKRSLCFVWRYGSIGLLLVVG